MSNKISPNNPPPCMPVAAIQLRSQQDIEQNIQTITLAVAAASHAGAHLVVLPENACSMGRQQQTAERFEALSSKMADLACQHGIYLVAGTLPCPYRPDHSLISDGRLRQVSQLFAPDGDCIARYDKIHLFTATVDDEQGSYNEAATFEPGNQTVVAPISFAGHTFGLGMMVCFDLRFPALAQRLRQAGADLLSAPSAFTYRTGQAHWQLLLRARALDSQCMVLGAAQGGTHHYGSGTTRQTWGHAAITRCDGACVNEFPHSDMSETALNPTDKLTDDLTDNLTDESANRIISGAGYAVVMSKFDAQMQRQVRQQLPTINCHRLG